MPGTIHFILDGEARSVADAAPTATALDWLREAAGRRGAKEGCAEGDCGACTIVLGEAGHGRMRYQAVNSCLMALPQLGGKFVLTVEGLAEAGGALHPVQQALVDTDGTQCGFCTPGFVMALFAFAHSGEAADDDTIHDVLAGNLCRCTGYRPIVDAARRVGGRVRDRFAAGEAGIADMLAALPRAGRTYAFGAQRFFAPRTVAGLARLCADHPDARLLAGGTDLGLSIAKDREPHETLISVSHVPRLRRVLRRRGEIEIGAAATYTQVLPVFDRHYPSFARLIRRLGSRQIRNLGTIGGNVGTASPIGDSLPCLIALDATLVLRSVAARREMPIEEFFLGYRETALAPGEFIEAIRVPLLDEGRRFNAYKISKRFDQDISAVICACRIRVDGGIVTDLRIAYGGMAATPKRARACEAALLGKPWSEAAARAAADALAADYAPIDDFRASAAYRSEVAANLLIRLHAQTAGRVAPSEVAAL